MDTILAELRTLISSGLEFILSEVILRQLSAAVLIGLLAWLLRFPVRRLLKRIEGRLAGVAWSLKLLAVTHRIVLPLIVRILGELSLEIFRVTGRESHFLEWANRLVTLWFIYGLLAALLDVNLPPPQAKFWRRKVLLPVALISTALQAAGLLNSVLAWSLSLGQQNLEISLGSLVSGVVILAVFFILARGVRQFLEQTFLPQAGAEPALTHAITALITYALIILGVGVGLSAIGVDLTTLTVILGGLSVGLGFGLQEIVSNFVSGFILLFERSIGPGDVVRIGDATGVVQRVGIRSLIVRTRDNIELIVPNSYFLTEIVTNLTRSEGSVRARVSVGVTYQASPRQVEQALLEAAQHPDILEQPAPTVQFRDFGESSLNFDLLVWTYQADRLEPLLSDLRYRVWDSLAAHNIEIPFPQRDLHIRSNIPVAGLIQPDKTSPVQGSSR